jgi:exosortase family protein XrtF
MHPSLKFLLKFIVAYLLGNIAYWLSTELFKPDPFTELAAYLLDSTFHSIKTTLKPDASGFIVFLKQKPMVNIAEGCNGMSIFITLLSFCLAFGGNANAFLWFIPSSFAALQLGNMLRLWLLVYIKSNYNAQFPLFHEYVFPAVLYGFAFLIMVFWVKFQKNKSAEVNTEVNEK